MKVWEALVQRQVKFNRVPEKLPEKVPGGIGTDLEVRINTIPMKYLICEALIQSQVKFNGFRRKLQKRRFWKSLVQGRA